MVRILEDAINRADLDALGGLVVADALGAKVRVNLVYLVALTDGTVRALRLANVAVYAFVGDVKGPCGTPEAGVNRFGRDLG
jgi:hypothetical protein